MNLNELFIPYEESVELKELGFDEPCFKCYTSMGRLINAGNSNQISIEGINACSAPTFSQAFRWFREKHNFDLFWKPMSMIGITCYYDIEIHHPKYIWDKPPKVTGKSYSEAELACLKKLIEIVKTLKP